MLRPTIVATDDTIFQIVKDEISKYGNNADLNHIDVSNVTNMSSIFESSSFNGNISKWNVSNVTNMSCMFNGSSFNGDLSRWDVSKVTDMAHMFQESLFNGDIYQWNVSNVIDMSDMFKFSAFNGNILDWRLHADCDVYAMLYISDVPILPPLLPLDSIETYRETLYTMIGESDDGFHATANITCSIHASHGALVLLLSHDDLTAIHPDLKPEDQEQLRTLYQLTGSVYQSALAWEQQRKRTVPFMNTSIDSLCN